jgi:hypothetical protein
MENIIYYFFSTVPQVLAALIALIGAFHIFRNQNLLDSFYGNAQVAYDLGYKSPFGFILEELKDFQKEMISRNVKSIYNFASSFTKKESIYIKLVNKLKETYDDEGVIVEKIFPMLLILSKVTATHEKRILLNKKFKQITILAFVIIIASITVLALTNLLPNYLTILLIIIVISSVTVNLFLVYKFLSDN